MQLAPRFTIQAWAEEENAKGHFCACGCGQRVRVLPMHRKNAIPKYVPEHCPSRFGAEIQALHAQGLMTATDLARELCLQRKAVHPFADEIIGHTPRVGSRQIRVFTPKQVAKLRAELARRAHPRHDLTDAQWAKVAPIVSPPPKQRSGRVRADRAMVNAIRWIQRTGASWKAMPDRYPLGSTCQVRLATWNRDGTWARVCQVLA
ncbi:transposase [Polyangium sp. 6x1]|uniref:transposase n=1 Tax=Polyangium sp. 6x1 TaxID=3042689 RepID=UPI0024827C29|nr:transposase [Polyangium sp. 6x1]MDI1450792.1 transposase [Polyangium sp. 6x1]